MEFKSIYSKMTQDNIIYSVDYTLKKIDGSLRVILMDYEEIKSNKGLLANLVRTYDDYYCYHINTSYDSEEPMVIMPSLVNKNIYHFAKVDRPIIYTKDNAIQNLANDTIDVVITVDKTEYLIQMDKNNIFVYNLDRKIGYIIENGSVKVEYNFADNFVYINREENEMITLADSCKIYGHFIDYNFISNKSGCSIIDNKITEYIIEKDGTELRYLADLDDFGIVKSLRQSGNNEEDLCRYHNGGNFIRSLYPLILDPFNPKYSDPNLTTWVYDTYEKVFNDIMVSRVVFKI